MNKALFLSTLKSKYKLILLCSAALIMYSVMIISMFDPNNAAISKMEMMPESFTKALGLTIMEPGLTAFLGTTMYSIPYMIFMIIFVVIASNSLIARNVDRGSMAFFLSTPVSRTRVAITQGSVLITGQIIMATLLTFLSIIAANATFGSGALEIGIFIKLNLMGLLVFFVVGAYSFLFSCLFNEEKYSLTFSAGLTLLFYIINIASNSSSDDTWLNKISIFGYFNPAKIINGTVEILPIAIIFCILGVILYGASLYIFNKRNLPL